MPTAICNISAYNSASYNKSHYLPESLAPGGPYSENGHRFLEQILGKSLMEINGNQGKVAPISCSNTRLNVKMAMKVDDARTRKDAFLNFKISIL